MFYLFFSIRRLRLLSVNSRNIAVMLEFQTWAKPVTQLRTNMIIPSKATSHRNAHVSGQLFVGAAICSDVMVSRSIKTRDKITQ